MPATLDVFAAAPTVKAKKEPKKGPEEILIGKDLEIFAAASAVMASLKSVATIYESRVKDAMAGLFAHMGTEKNGRPDNFRGTSDNASASCELRKRDSRRELSKEEAEYLQSKGVSVEEKVIDEERFFFNEEIMTDPVLRKKVADALAKIDFGGKAPILRQEPKSIQVVSDSSVDEAFKMAGSEEEAKKMIAVIGTLAIKPKFDGDLKAAVEVLDKAGVKL